MMEFKRNIGKSNFINNMAPPSAWGMALEDKQTTVAISGPQQFQTTKCKERTTEDVIVEKCIDLDEADIHHDRDTTIAIPTAAALSDKASNTKEGDGNNATADDFFSVGNAMTATEASAQEKERDVKEYIQRWEQHALNHFRNSSWKDVILACEKVFQVPGQSTTNFNVLYELGYAHMRLGDYEVAAAHFAASHRIDSKSVPLRLVMHDLRRKIATEPWRKKRSREEQNNAPLSSRSNNGNIRSEHQAPPKKQKQQPPVSDRVCSSHPSIQK